VARYGLVRGGMVGCGVFSNGGVLILPSFYGLIIKKNVLNDRWILYRIGKIF